jgi:hypothetical protein
LVIAIGGGLALLLFSHLRATGSVRQVLAAGDIERLRKTLAEAPARATTPDEDGEQPIHLAAQCGQVEAIKLLLQHGADPGVRCDGGGTPLMMAVNTGQRASVECLLDAGADVDDPDDRGVTPLHYAVSLGDQAMAEVLLARGAQPNFKDAAGRTSLDLAAASSPSTLVTMLKARGGKPGSEVHMRDLPPPRTAGGMHRVPSVLGLPLDSPQLEQARQRAQRELAELERLIQTPSARAAVKYAPDREMPNELVWMQVDAIANGKARGVLVSDPLLANAPRGGRAQVALADVTDWVVALDGGVLRGGYGLSVLIAHARDEYGVLPPAMIELERQLAR